MLFFLLLASLGLFWVLRKNGNRGVRKRGLFDPEYWITIVNELPYPIDVGTKAKGWLNLGNCQEFQPELQNIPPQGMRQLYMRCCLMKQGIDVYETYKERKPGWRASYYLPINDEYECDKHIVLKVRLVKVPTGLPKPNDFFYNVQVVPLNGDNPYVGKDWDPYRREHKN